jgi:dihydropteroate synthase
LIDATPPILGAGAVAALVQAELDRLGLPPAEVAAAGAAWGLDAPRYHRPRYLSWGATTLPVGARTLVMGVINVTDDSFSGDGLGSDLGVVLARAEALVAAGADVLDVGGESTRPGAPTVPADEERARVEPAVALLARRLRVPLSVDTRKASVAAAAVAAGAGAVNDVTGLRFDPALAGVVAGTGAALILGHWAPRRPSPGAAANAVVPRESASGKASARRIREPADPGGAAAVRGSPPPAGGDPVAEVLAGLAWSIGQALAAGVPRERLAVDPGLGFAKPAWLSLALLRALRRLGALDLPVVVGPSRKGFIGRALGVEAQRGWEGTAAAVALAVAGGAAIVRVHDVARLARVVRMADAVLSAEC